MIQLAHDIVPRPELFAVTADGRFLFVAGHWNKSFGVICTDGSLKGVQQIMRKHDDIVTCLTLNESKSILVTGSRDTTLMVWNVEYPNNNTGCRVNRRARHVLFGHEEEVTCVAVSNDYDVVVSGSKGGTVLIHSLRDGRLVRSIHVADAASKSLLPSLDVTGRILSSPSASRSRSASHTPSSVNPDDTSLIFSGVHPSISDSLVDADDGLLSPQTAAAEDDVPADSRQQQQQQQPPFASDNPGRGQNNFGRSIAHVLITAEGSIIVNSVRKTQTVVQ